MTGVHDVGFVCCEGRPPTKCNCLSCTLKVWLHLICILGDITIFIFRLFGLNLPVHAHFWRFCALGHIPPQMASTVVLIPKTARGNIV